MPGIYTERIQVIIETFVKGFEPTANRVNSSLKKMSDGLKETQTVLRTDLLTWKENREQYEKTGNILTRLVSRFRMSTHGLRGFRMELLSVMFFGKMVSSTLFGLLQPAAEAIGIFDLFRILLEVLFLPIMVAILPYLLDILDFFLKLDPNVQLAIGAVVLFGAAVFGILGFLAALRLGLGGLITDFGLQGIAGAAGSATGAMTGLEGKVVAAEAVTSGFGAKLLAFGMKVIGVSFIITGIAQALSDTSKMVDSILQIIAGAGFLVGGKTGAVVGIGALIVRMVYRSFTNEDLSLMGQAQEIIAVAIGGFMIAGPAGAIIGLGFKLIWEGVQWDQKKANEATRQAGLYTEEMLTGQTESWVSGTKSLWAQQYDMMLKNGQIMVNAQQQTGSNINDKWSNSLNTRVEITKEMMEESYGFYDKNLKMMEQTNVEIGNQIVLDTTDWVTKTNAELAKLKFPEYNITSYGTAVPKTAKGTVGFTESGRAYNIEETSFAKDFVWRPGYSPVAFSPTDTVIGTKAGGGSIGGNITVNQTLNISVSDADQIRRLIAESNSRLVDDLRRITKGAV